MGTPDSIRQTSSTVNFKTEAVKAPAPDGRRWADGRRWEAEEVHVFQVKSRDLTGNVLEVFCTYCGGVLAV